MAVVIKVDDLSKQYRLGLIGTRTLKGDLQRWWYNVRGLPDPTLIIGQENRLNISDTSRAGVDDFVWALKDINFEVQQGEVLGIIGKNGAGKSTLLKLLSRVTAPTTGSIKVRGRIASLLEVGTGFHPELTGRENIFLNGAILGMTKSEIRKKFDEIVEFAGVAKYIDTPVKRYSSGMYVRLAFAVAAHLEPEILIVDEVLAVGDAEFQKKAIGKMQDVSTREGRTVLFVSHNIGAVKSLCRNGLLLECGRIIETGTVNNIIDKYLKVKGEDITEKWVSDEIIRPICFSKIAFKGLTGKQPRLKIDIEVELKTTDEHKRCFLAFDITDDNLVPVFQTIPEMEIKSEPGIKSFQIRLDLPPLIPGHYLVKAWIGPHNNETFHMVNNSIGFRINESPKENWIFPFAKDHGNLIMKSSLSDAKRDK